MAGPPSASVSKSDDRPARADPRAVVRPRPRPRPRASALAPLGYLSLELPEGWKAIRADTKRAVALLKAKRFVQAQQLAQAVLAEQPAAVEAELVLAASLFGRGLLPAAWQRLERVLARDLVRYRQVVLTHESFAALRLGAPRQRLMTLLAKLAQRYRKALAIPGARFVARRGTGYDVHQRLPASGRFVRLSETGRVIVGWGLDPGRQTLLVITAASWVAHEGVIERETSGLTVLSVNLRSFEQGRVINPSSEFVDCHLASDSKGRLWLVGRSFADATEYHELDVKRGTAKQRSRRTLPGARLLGRQTGGEVASRPKGTKGTKRLPRLRLDRRRGLLRLAGRAGPITVAKKLNHDPRWSADGRFVFLRRSIGGDCDHDDFGGLSRTDFYAVEVATGRVSQLHSVKGAAQFVYIPGVGILIKDPMGVHLWRPGPATDPLRGRTTSLTTDGSISGDAGPRDPCGA